ncbi:MAG: hypothetical protein ACETVX_06165 [bacterium]
MKRLLVLFFGFTAFTHLSAQSFFAMGGLGEEIITFDARSGSLGGISALSYQNPSYPLIRQNTILEAAIIGSGVYGKDTDKRRFIAGVRPNYLKGIFGLPLGFGIGLGLAERFNQNFDIFSDSQAGYQRHIVGYGGIYNFNLSLARTFYNILGLGVEYNRNFGNSLERWFFETSQTTTITTDTVITEYRGDGLKFGVSAQVWAFNLGAVYEKPMPLYINGQVLSHGIVTDSFSDLKFEYPPRIGFGLSFDAIPKLTIYLDYFNRKSKNTKVADTAWSIFRNSNKYSIGFEYNLDDKHPLRVGYRYYDWYFTETSNQVINEQALTLGSGIPIPGFGVFDFTIELINRKGGALTERIGRLNLTLHYEEAWKIRKRRWGY